MAMLRDEKHECNVQNATHPISMVKKKIPMVRDEKPHFYNFSFGIQSRREEFRFQIYTPTCLFCFKLLYMYWSFLYSFKSEFPTIFKNTQTFYLRILLRYSDCIKLTVTMILPK